VPSPPIPRRRSFFNSQIEAVEIKLQSALRRSWFTGVAKSARRDIEEALDLLSKLDIDDPPGPDPPIRRVSAWINGRASGSSSSQLMSLIAERSGGADGEVDVGRTMTENRRWLVQNFTDADLEAAEGHEAGSATISPSHTETGSGGGEVAEASASEGPRRRRNSHEMDQHVRSLLQGPDIAQLLERAGKFDFDALSFYELPAIKRQPLQCLGAHLLQQNNLVPTLVSQGQVPEAVERKFETCLVRFLGKIDELYLPESAYHNAAHAADVMMTIEWFLQTKFCQAQVSTLEHVMALVAGAVHDVGHPGRTNDFQAKTMAPLAVTYNDKSILENMHIAKCFETMQSDSALNWFALLPSKHASPDDSGQKKNLQQYVRRGLIDMVLATDMMKHSEHVRKIKLFVEELREESLRAQSDGSVEELVPHKPPAEKQDALEKKLLLLETILHAADISNPCKPRPIMLRWTERVLAEFWAQGDDEKSMGLEMGPLNNRESGKQAVPKGQAAFIIHIVRPFYVPIAEMITEVDEAVQELDKNLAFWRERDSEQAKYEELFPSSPRKFAPPARDVC